MKIAKKKPVKEVVKAKIAKVKDKVKSIKGKVKVYDTTKSKPVLVVEKESQYTP